MACSACSRRSASSTSPAARTSSPRDWARAIAAVDTPVPPGPVTATTVPRHWGGAGPGQQVGGWSLAAPDGAGARHEGGDQLVAGEARAQHPRRAQCRPVARRPAVVDDQYRAVGGGAAASRSRSTAGRPASATSAENGRPDASRARTSSAETHFRNSAGRAPEVDPDADRAEPFGSGRSQAEDDEALAGDHGTGAGCRNAGGGPPSLGTPVVRMTVSFPAWAAWARASACAPSSRATVTSTGPVSPEPASSPLEADDKHAAGHADGVGVVARAVGGHQVDLLAGGDGRAQMAPLDGERHLPAADLARLGHHRAGLDQLARLEGGEESGADEYRRVVEGPGPRRRRELHGFGGQVARLEPGAGGQRRGRPPRRCRRRGALPATPPRTGRRPQLQPTARRPRLDCPAATGGWQSAGPRRCGPVPAPSTLGRDAVSAIAPALVRLPDAE